MNNSFKISILLLISILFSGCAIVKTYKRPGPIETAIDLEREGKGVTYFLPKRRVKITAKATKLSTEIQKRLETAKTNLATATKNLTEAESQVKAKKVFHDQMVEEKDEPGIKKAKTALAEAKAQRDITKQNFVKARTALDSIERQIATSSTQSENETCPALTYSFKLELQEPEPDPDPDHIYRAILDHSILRDDKVTFSVNEKGLLSNSKLETTDRTADILVEIAKAVSIAISPGTGFFHATTEDTDKTVPTDLCPEPFVFEDIFDPTIDKEVLTVNETLTKLWMNKLYGKGTQFRINVHGGYLDDNVNKTNSILPNNEFDLDEPNNNLNFHGKNFAPGLIYRSALPYIISVEECVSVKNINRKITKLSCSEDNNNLKDYIPIQTALMMLPNRGPISVVPFTAGPFVKTVHDVEFKDGILTKWEADKPSELLAFVRLPVELAKAIISAPAEIIKLRLDLTNQQTSLLEAQKAQIEAAEALREIKLELDKAALQDSGTEDGS